MTTSAQRFRAGATALLVVFAFAVIGSLLIVALGLSVGFVWGSLFGGASPSGGAAPQVTFAVTAADGEASITHEGGDAVAAEAVAIEIAGSNRGTWADHADTGTVSDGDSITIDGVRTGDAVRLYWLRDGDALLIHDGTA